VSGAWIVTVGAAQLGAADDPAGMMVARALLAEGVPVASRQVVDEDETAVEEALRGAVEAAALVVVLAQPGGSSGEVVRRALSRLGGARLVLNDKLLASMEEDFARRGQAIRDGSIAWRCCRRVRCSGRGRGSPRGCSRPGAPRSRCCRPAPRCSPRSWSRT
jgi:molybdopterin-biosynthesis enzyme MoeA-like protein